MKRCYLFVLIAALLGACHSVAPGSDGYGSGTKAAAEAAQIRLELAADYYLAGKFDIALQETAAVLAKAPRLADAYSLRGLIYMELDNLAAAEENLTKAVQLSKKDPAILHNYGYLLCQKKDYAAAQIYFNRALAVPDYRNKMTTYLAQAGCAIDAREFVIAHHALTQALALEAQNPLARYQLARLYYLRAEYTAAWEILNKLNTSLQANEKTLWLGILVANKLNKTHEIDALGSRLRAKYFDFDEYRWYQNKQY